MVSLVTQNSALPGAPDFSGKGVSYLETDWDDILRPGQPPLWALLDGVNCPEASQRLPVSNQPNACLYTTTDPGTKASAPWLVLLEPDSDTVQWLKRLPHDQHWGIMFQSKAPLKDLRAHLRKFTMLWTPADQNAPVYFRFYDPRVAVDMAQALEPWKFSRFMAPLECLIAPLSPLMIVPETLRLTTPLALDTEAVECKGRMVSVTLDDTQRDDTQNAKSFSISHVEFDRFGVLQKQKANRKMAREMMPAYPNHSPPAILAAVEHAAGIGQTYGMTSKKQTRTLTKCVLEFGENCLETYPGLTKTIANRNIEAWQRRRIVEEWIPRGRIRRDLMQKTQSQMIHPYFMQDKTRK